uniref:Uncharacterized protein n=1 Tax=Anguilla anguilla TaxID=7936 RepID=A0A0E9WSL3_ANGAN
MNSVINIHICFVQRDTAGLRRANDTVNTLSRVVQSNAALTVVLRGQLVSSLQGFCYWLRARQKTVESQTAML